MSARESSTAAPTAGGWVILFRMRNDFRTNHVHNAEEVRSVVGAWVNMRNARKEPVFASVGAKFGDIGSSDGLLCRVFGRSDHDLKTTQAMLEELAGLIGFQLGQKHMEVFVGGMLIPMTRMDPPAQQVHFKLH